MLNNKDFYPTPKMLAMKMLAKLDTKRTITTVLEPSAGKADLVDAVTKHFQYNLYSDKIDVSCIENDENLFSLLVGKGYKVIDHDFLQYYGVKHYDLIIANPPFSQGAEHLLKAIDIMYSGQIVFLLNEETLKNPCTAARKQLKNKLIELDADIEYLSNSFIDAERKTSVGVALVYINIVKDVKTDLTEGMDDKVIDKEATIEDISDVSAAKNKVQSVIEDYNATVKAGLTVLEGYFKHYEQIGGYIHINGGTEFGEMEGTVKEKINQFVDRVRRSHWMDILELDEVKAKLTQSGNSSFREKIERQTNIELTEPNIRAFIHNLVKSYPQMLDMAVGELFDTMTRKHSFGEDLSVNVHLFDGWKTNKGFFVNEKVVLPFRSWGPAFFNEYKGFPEVHYSITGQLNDIDKVMDFFNPEPRTVYEVGEKWNNQKITDKANDQYQVGGEWFHKSIVEKDCELTIVKAINAQELTGKSRKIDSKHFTISIFKKGTIHLSFKSEDTRRRFNIQACKGKNWLPKNYGSQSFTDMDEEERSVVQAFEGFKSYRKNLGSVGYIGQGDVSKLISFDK